jgi:hypothetical protein
MLTRAYPPSFEIGFLARVKTLVDALPAETATLKTKSEIGCVYFSISPTNQQSAGIEGEASIQGGINFKVGRATITELSPSNEDRFFQICEVVFGSHFTESVTYSSSGRVLYSRIHLAVDGSTVRLGGHQLFWWLYPNRRKERFYYKPYY